MEIYVEEPATFSQFFCHVTEDRVDVVCSEPGQDGVGGCAHPCERVGPDVVALAQERLVPVVVADQLTGLRDRHVICRDDLGVTHHLGTKHLASCCDAQFGIRRKSSDGLVHEATTIAQGDDSDT